MIWITTRSGFGVNQTQIDYARMLLTRAAPDDGKRAATLLSQAIFTYDELGMRGSASRARAVAASPSTRRRR